MSCRRLLPRRNRPAQPPSGRRHKAIKPDRLASGLLWFSGPGFFIWAFAAASLSGCFLPQEDTLLDPVPPPLNRPPVILENLISPQPIVNTNNGNGCSLEFSLYVEDPDDGDVVNIEWQIVDDTLHPAQAQSPESFVSQGAAHPYHSTYVPNLSLPADPLHSPREHLLQAVVADGTPIRAPLPRNTFADGGINPQYSVLHSWFVNVQQGDCSQ